MAKSFDDLMSQFPPAVRRAALAKAKRYKTEIEAAEIVKAIRKTAKLGQVELASAMGIKQPAIAKMERQQDMKLSTLRALVKAAGGTMKIHVKLPERRGLVIN